MNLIDQILPYLVWTPLELAANVITAICIVLAGRNSVHTWWTGILGSILFGILFYKSKLYADATLQIFFIVTGIIGWMQWRGASTTKLNARWGDFVPITRTDSSYLTYGIIIAIMVAFVYGSLLYSYTDAFAPGIDSTVLAFSVLGQLLLMRRNVETWNVWLLVNTLSIPLFWSRELYLTSILYSFFWCNALVSGLHWYKLMKEQNESI